MTQLEEYDIIKELHNYFLHNNILHGFVKKFEKFDNFLCDYQCLKDWFTEEIRSVNCICCKNKAPEDIEYEYCIKMVNKDFLTALYIKIKMLENGNATVPVIENL